MLSHLNLLHGTCRKLTCDQETKEPPPKKKAINGWWSKEKLLLVFFFLPRSFNDKSLVPKFVPEL